MNRKIQKNKMKAVPLILGLSASIGAVSCHNNVAGQAGMAQQGSQSLPVISISSGEASDTTKYSGTIQGISNVDIQPQVSGYLKRIFVEEGAFVHIGQVLFQIDDRTYRESLANANASLQAAEANVLTAKISVEKQENLLEKKVVSPIALKTAKANYAAAVAGVAQAQAAVQSARINLDFCTIKAPVSGYVGSIPNKIGSLVSPGGAIGLTTISDVSKVYVYFSLGEDAYSDFQKKYAGATVHEKIKSMPSVLLRLSDGSIYEQPGKVEVVEGQFSQSTASIQFRATFNNPGGKLRTGNTGVVLIPQNLGTATLVPIASTTDLQDKVYVWKVDGKNNVHQAILTINGKSGTNYIVSEGISSGDKIVQSGFDRLAENTPISPIAGK